MFFEIISMFLGIIKLFFFKIIYPTRVSFRNIPRMNNSFNIAIKRNSKLILGKNFRTRNNVSFRIYNRGVVAIGNNCFMNDNCSINCQKSITIGDNVILGQNTMIFDHDHDYKNNMDEFLRDEVKIGNNVWIGANVTILKGVSIGDNVVIAANSLIRKSIKDNSIVYQEKRMVQKSKE